MSYIEKNLTTSEFERVKQSSNTFGLLAIWIDGLEPVLRKMDERADSALSYYELNTRVFENMVQNADHVKIVKEALDAWNHCGETTIMFDNFLTDFLKFKDEALNTLDLLYRKKLPANATDLANQYVNLCEAINQRGSVLKERLVQSDKTLKKFETSLNQSLN